MKKLQLFGRALLLLTLWLLPLTHARAVEIFSLIDRDCDSHSGLIVHVSATTVEILNLDGQYERVEREDVASILVFNSVVNPIAKIEASPALQSHLRDIRLVEGEDKAVTGFTLRTLEKLVVFYDLTGTTRVHDLHEVKSVRPAAFPRPIVRLAKYERPTLDFESASSQCALPAHPRGLKPSRLLRDKIQVQELFEELKEGYEAIESFAERTYLYARPLLYKSESRLGFSSVKDDLEYPSLMNIYFQWSGGEPYRFQSLNVLGGKSFEYVPNVEPVFAFRSDVKSHLFHGVLIANLGGIAAGKSVFPDDVSEDISSSDLTAFHYSFNYLGLIGADYGPWSFSAGYFFPSFLIVTGNEAREVLASKASYVGRVVFTKERYRLRLIATTNSYDRSEPSDNDLEVQDREGSALTLPDRFDFEYSFLRAGIENDWSDQLSTSLDYIFLEGDYKDVTSSTTQRLEFRRNVFSAQAKLQFGDYTAVGLRVNQMKVYEKYGFASTNKTEDEWRTGFVGEFEFVF